MTYKIIQTIPDYLGFANIIRGRIHTQIATRNVKLTKGGVWVFFFDVLFVAIWHFLLSVSF